jgi:phospho-2-dehydro-3-deoxyheptonate aldolase
MVDASHANSSKRFKQQIEVATDTASQLAAGDERIIGVMVESHLVEGRQDLVPGPAAGVRQEHHRCLPGLGRFADGSGTSRAKGSVLAAW